jgi:hypothetical protein
MYLARVCGFSGSVSRGTYREVEMSALLTTRELAEAWLELNIPRVNIYTWSSIEEYIVISKEEQLT